MTKQSKRGQQAPHTMTKRQLARWERERQLNRRLIIGVSTAVALALVVLVGGIIWDRLIQPAQSVAKIGSKEISRGDYITYREMSLAQRIIDSQSQIRQYESFLQQFGGGEQGEQFSQQFQSQIQQLQSEVDIALPQLRDVRNADLDYAALDQLIEEEVILQASSSTTATVDDDDVNRALAVAYAGLLPEPEPTPVPVTPTITGTTALTPTATVAATPGVTDTGSITGTLQPTATSTITPTATATLTADKARNDTETALLTYYDQLKQSIEAQDTQISLRFSKEEFLDFMRRQQRVQLLRTQIQGALVKEGPRVLQARVQHILIKHTAAETDTQEIKDQAFAEALSKAETIYDRLTKNNEDFNTVAISESMDEGSASNGGIYEWTPIETSGWVEEFKKAAQEQPVNEIGKPFKTQFGYHIMRVLGREERPDNSKLEELRTTKLTEWLTAKKAELGVQRFPEPTAVPTLPIVDTPTPDPLLASPTLDPAAVSPTTAPAGSEGSASPTAGAASPTATTTP